MAANDQFADPKLGVLRTSRSQVEVLRRAEVMSAILACVRENRTIKLPAFDPTLSRPSDRFALLSVGLEANEFSGTVGEFRYQFEGEEDLLHLIVTRQDSQPLSVEEGQAVAGFLLASVPPALIWLKPGEYSQHFYLGHDDLVGNLALGEAAPSPPLRRQKHSEAAEE